VRHSGRIIGAVPNGVYRNEFAAIKNPQLSGPIRFICADGESEIDKNIVEYFDISQTLFILI
jgi:hypothetical protein